MWYEGGIEPRKTILYLQIMSSRNMDKILYTSCLRHLNEYMVSSNVNQESRKHRQYLLT